MLSPYQVRLQKIRNKQVPSSSASNKILRSKKLAKVNVRGLSYQLLLNKAQLVFNAWIRKRDQDKRCVSCKSKKIRHASHYYAVGSYYGLRFDEHNANGSCENCNTFMYGNLAAYRKELLIRIGAAALLRLDQLASVNKRKKYSRADLEEVIKKYRS